MSKIDKMFVNLNGRKIIIDGDFNLNGFQPSAIDYKNKHLFELQNLIIEKYNLIQTIEFPTRKRVVNSVIKELVLDHVYVKDLSIICNINAIEPLSGKYKIVIFDISNVSEPEKSSQNILDKHLANNYCWTSQQWQILKQKLMMCKAPGTTSKMDYYP